LSTIQTIFNLIECYQGNKQRVRIRGQSETVAVDRELRRVECQTWLGDRRERNTSSLSAPLSIPPPQEYN
jgi:hypothetical protein